MEILSGLFPELPADRLPQSPIRAIGIDLGTTNSVVAEVMWDPATADFGAASCLEVKQATQEGDYVHNLVPSVVALHDGVEFVGEGAKRLRSMSVSKGLEQQRNMFYECKNEIGTSRTYHKAPQGYRSPAEISGRVLRYLADAALEQGDAPTRTVVTVPASFQAAQREDTLRAAATAGIELHGGDLLDEPVAAFLDYILSEGFRLLPRLEKPKTLVVFDFGGGTCDVAIFAIAKPSGKAHLEIRPLTVSRYHRLGGGDIDAAILHELLVPMLCEQNGLERFDLSYEDKKLYIEPAFLSVAEALKIGLCIEVARRKRLGKYEGPSEEVRSQQPGVHSCTLKGGRTLSLQTPRLTAVQFEAVLAPFLEQDLLHTFENEYRTSGSIFSPLADALDRAGLEPEDVDFCLMVGGSSLIPQIVESVDGFFDRAEMLTFSDRDAQQTAIARGAAYHALSLALYGHGLVQTVCHDGIALETSQGMLELVPQGAVLPWPASTDFNENYPLSIPQTVGKGEIFPLQVQVVAASDERRIFSKVWQIPGPLRKGDPLYLRYRFDENQVLQLALKLGPADEDEAFIAEISNPFTHVVNPNAVRVRILETEERLRTGAISPSRIKDSLKGLAIDYAEIGQHEKALDYLKKALTGEQGERASHLLNLMGIYADRLGDSQKAEKFYRSAGEMASNCAAWFNLSFVLQKEGRMTEAIAAVERAIEEEDEPAYHIRRAILALSVGDQATCDRELEHGMASFEPVQLLADYALSWFLAGARMIGDETRMRQAQAEQRKRKQRGDTQTEAGILPDLNPVA